MAKRKRKNKETAEQMAMDALSAFILRDEIARQCDEKIEYDNGLIDRGRSALAALMKKNGELVE